MSGLPAITPRLAAKIDPQIKQAIEKDIFIATLNPRPANVRVEYKDYNDTEYPGWHTAE